MPHTLFAPPISDSVKDTWVYKHSSTKETTCIQNLDTKRIVQLHFLKKHFPISYVLWNNFNFKYFLHNSTCNESSPPHPLDPNNAKKLISNSVSLTTEIHKKSQQRFSDVFILLSFKSPTS